VWCGAGRLREKSLSEPKIRNPQVDSRIVEITSEHWRLPNELRVVRHAKESSRPGDAWSFEYRNSLSFAVGQRTGIYKHTMYNMYICMYVV